MNSAVIQMLNSFLFRWVMVAKQWLEAWTIRRSAYPWRPPWRWPTGGGRRWRRATCCCCFGGNLTWEEDWRWCLERPSVRGNSRRWKKQTKKKKALFLDLNVDAHVRRRMCRLVCWILHSPPTSPSPFWWKSYWVWGGWCVINGGGHLQTPCEASPAELRPAEKSRSNAGKVSALHW